ncbi:MAG: ATP-binding protein [candidate division Zixibacteria bacterium]|nr:ATP-binding protein [candidate division Zixibacteria bacterium]
MKNINHTKDIKVTSILFFRLVIFLILLAVSFLFLPLTSVLSLYFALYGTVTLAFLLSLIFPNHPWVKKSFTLIGFAQLFLEVALEALVVHYSGGMNSPLAILFFLTIVSASLNSQLIGTVIVASWASLIYSGAVLIAAGWTPSNIFSHRFFEAVWKLGDEYFYTLFIYLCSFYLVAFISGFLAQKLKIKAELLLTASRQLRQIKMETDDILQQLHSGVVTIDKTGRIVYFNRAAEEILQYKGNKVKGKDCLSVFKERMPDLGDELISGLITGQSRDRKEIITADLQGRPVPIGMGTSLLKDETGDMAGVVGLFQDLRGIKKLEEELRNKDKLAVIGELAAGIAHEIRNPLASISGSVEVLKQELNLEGDNSNLLELVIKESQRLNQILTDFLNFARIHSTYLTKVDLIPVLEEVIAIVKKHPSYREHIQIESRLPQGPLLVKGEENQIKQLFLNLLINAVESMEDRSGKIILVNSALEGPPDNHPQPPSQHSKWVPVAVSDEGKGISPEQLEKIYIPFYSSKRQGTGLGLSIVQRLVDSLEGKIDCRSVPGRGTTFVVYLKNYQPSDSSKQELESALLASL